MPSWSQLLGSPPSQGMELVFVLPATHVGRAGTVGEGPHGSGLAPSLLAVEPSQSPSIRWSSQQSKSQQNQVQAQGLRPTDHLLPLLTWHHFSLLTLHAAPQGPPE